MIVTPCQSYLDIHWIGPIIDNRLSLYNLRFAALFTCYTRQFERRMHRFLCLFSWATSVQYSPTSGWSLFIFLAFLSRYLNIYLVLEVPVKISPVRDDHIRALQHYICVPLSVTNYLFSVTVKWSLCAMVQSGASVIFSVETRAWTENNAWWTLTMALLFLQIRYL